jgi:hypothetical protein
VDESTSGVPQKQTEKEDKTDVVETFGKEPYRKEFTEEKWEKVKRVIRDEFGMTVGEVVNSPNQERYELLHEAVLFNESDTDSGDSEHSSNKRCSYCDKACDSTSVIIEERRFCVHHTAAQIETVLNDD